MFSRISFILILLFSNFSYSEDSLENNLERLVLQKERLKAIDLLKKELDKKETSREKKGELKNQLARIETMFFTDEAQKQYQIGLSQLFNDTSQSKIHFEKASQLEPNNKEIILANIIVNLRLRNCNQAKKIFESTQMLWQLSGNRQLIELQLKVCRGDYSLFSENEKEGLSSTEREQFNIHFTVLRIKSAIANKNFDIALELIKNGSSLDPEFPEITYWKWYILKSQKKENESVYESYLYQCKKMPLKKKIQYRWSYDLCLQSQQRASI